MPSHRIANLTDCSQFRQTLLAQPPVTTHAIALLLVALLGASLLWAGFTEADLVVRAKGRVRPMTRANRLADSAAEESTVAPLFDGRVVEVHVREGQFVKRGDLLIRFDDRDLLNDVARHERAIQAAQAEMTKSREMEQLMARRHATSRAKAAAELDQAERDIELAQQRRETDIEIAQVQLSATRDAYERASVLERKQATTAQDVLQAKTAFREASLKLAAARLPVDDGRLNVLRQAQELVEREHAVQVSELESRRALKAAEIDAAGLELDSLRLRLDQAKLAAPSDGIVTSLEAKVGEVLAAGKAALRLVDQQGFRLDVEVAGDDVGHLREGMPVRVKLDAYDLQKFGTATGKVVFISPDSQVADTTTATASPTYTIKVALDGDYVGSGALRGQIKLGMTGQADILTDKECILVLLLRSIRRSISLG